MTECQQCGAKSSRYLCNMCLSTLRDLFLGLATGHELPDGRQGAGWLEYLEDAALGRTRLGESARRSTDRTSPLPVNLTASELLDDVTSVLTHWYGVINAQVENLAVPGGDDG